MFGRKYSQGTFVGALVIMVLVLAGCGAVRSPDLTAPGTEPQTTPAETTAQEPAETTVTQRPAETTSSAEAPRDPEAILAPYRNQYAAINLPSEDFELQDLEGNLVRLSDLRGQVVFLNFWATWCPPCREEMPHMQVFHERYQDQDVVVLAVSPTSVELRGGSSSSRAERQVRAFIEEEGFTFPVLLDTEDAVWSVYQQRGIPVNYVIDAQGMVRYLKPGAFLSVEEMEAFLEAARIIQ